MEHLSSRISRKLVLLIVLFSSIITLFLTAMQLYLDYKAGIDDIHQHFTHIKVTNLDSIRQTLWTIDYSSLQIQLDGISRISDIIYAKILDESGNVVATAGKPEDKNTLSKTFFISQDYRGQEIYLGSLVIVATKRNLYQQLIDTTIVILLSQAVKTFIVGLFMFFIFYFLVTRHLNQIASYVKRLTLTDSPQPLTLNKAHDGKWHDELDDAADSINRMVNNILLSYETLNKSKQDLAEREAKFSAIFNSITDAIIITNTQREILQVNPAFTEMFGYTEAEAIGNTTEFLYASPEEYKSLQQERYNTEAAVRPSLYEINYRTKNGRIFPSETMGGSIVLQDGTQLGFLGIIRDIETRKTNEKETLNLQKQLHTAQKMEAIGQLTGGIAHDFNNILGSIIGYSDLSKQRIANSDDEKLKSYIDQIELAGDRAKNLIAQLLAFSRKTPGTIVSINLKPVIHDVIGLIRPTIPTTINIKTNINDNTPSVCMDVTQMHQILINLCINARDAIESHGAITLNLKYQTDIDALCNSCHQRVKGDFVVVSVEDSGCGIDNGALDRIFEPFHTTKGVGQGTGMGLAVVHGILHNNYSHILVDTEKSKGTKISLLIPPCKTNPPMSETPQMEVMSDKTLGKGKKILIVDDEKPITDFYQELLSEHGFSITSASSSTQALAVFKENPSSFDLVITDQTMPDMTGTELFRAIRKINQKVPFILCSGYSQQVGETEAFQLGFSSYLQKPVRNIDLLSSIKEIIFANHEED